ncbi:unknown [Rickettsia conorii str. Malish 7]|uniref:Uncharacterized protein n=1 Tax=Rickettsia conorii (strain ATCC VR-613 / Malish 7) TaxID=272944 RepID=Q92IJ6_RICCN|nr:unknown [Rickettsia conorii str. Malish 7]
MRGNYEIIDEAISGVCYYFMRLPYSLRLLVMTGWYPRRQCPTYNLLGSKLKLISFQWLKRAESRCSIGLACHTALIALSTKASQTLAGILGQIFLLTFACSTLPALSSVILIMTFTLLLPLTPAGTLLQCLSICLFIKDVSLSERGSPSV